MDRPTPVVTHLSGAYGGKTQHLSGDRLRLGPATDAEVHVHEADLPRETSAPPGGELATLERHGGTFELKAPADSGIYVNGRKVEFVVLDSGDVLEVGPGGPAIRFRVYEPGRPPKKSVREAMADCVDGARYTSRNPVRRAGIFLARAPRELVTQTTRIFRIGVVAVLIALIAGVGFLWVENRRLERRLTAEYAQVESLNDLLARAEQEAFTAEDFVAVRSDIEGRVDEALKRVEALEERMGARMRVIAGASPAVVFLQGAYGFVDPTSGRPLRFEEPVQPDLPRVTLDGSGREIEVPYTGTAFIVSEDGDLLTNRHVAAPWEFDPAAQDVIAMGLRPALRRFIGFLPGVAEPFEVELVRASDVHDLALLRCRSMPAGVPALTLGDERPRVGDEVIVLGYPTGIRALVARADPAFVEQLRGEASIDFWSVTRRLAAGGHIAPLATVGVVGQITASSVVYDADTTHGGSGGPVLDLEGRVVAVNAAILPEFGGSNLGVPAAEAVRLLTQDDRTPVPGDTAPGAGPGGSGQKVLSPR